MRISITMTQVVGLASSAALALTLVAAPAMANEKKTDKESYWFAVGDAKSKEGRLWATNYGECWESAYPDGPTNLPPCVKAEAKKEEPKPEPRPVPAEFTVRLNFEFDKFDMKNVVNRDELARLDDYIDNVKATPARERLTVIGHTDAVGSHAYNDRLGMNRARAVRNYLIKKGIPEQDIAPPQSRGKRELLPEYPPKALEQRRVKITASVN